MIWMLIRTTVCPSISVHIVVATFRAPLGELIGLPFFLAILTVSRYSGSMGSMAAEVLSSADKAILLLRPHLGTLWLSFLLRFHRICIVFR